MRQISLVCYQVRAAERITPTAQFVAAAQSRSRKARFLVPAALLAFVAAVIVVVVTSPGSGPQRGSGSARADVRKPPPFWTVHPGDTLSEIAQETGVSVDQLEAYNPNANPNALIPGEQLNLWAHPPPPPPPRPKPLGPRFWTVRPGQSFGSIAAATGINLAVIEQLNPKLHPATLQPGARVRLR